MNWKIFTTACATGLLGLLPQNGISCSDEGDADDYFTTFFSREVTTADPSLRPFFYTQSQAYYDQESYEEPGRNKALLREWQQAAGNATDRDVAELVYRTDARALRLLAGNPATLPDSLRNNSAVQAFLRQRRADIFQYLAFTRRSEALTVAGDWDASPRRDSLALARLSEAASVALATSSDPFLRPKWAFQRCKADFYAGNYKACVRHYDASFAAPTGAAVQPLALSYKGGALYKLGKTKEAAYVFSRVFLEPGVERTATYTGFRWSTNDADSSLRESYAAQGRNEQERAQLLALFALFGTGPQEAVLGRLMRMDPASALIPVIASREISKAEQQYLTTKWEWPRSGRSNLGAAEQKKERMQQQEAGRHVSALADLLSRAAPAAPAGKKAFYHAGTAWLRTMLGQWDAARKQLELAGSARPDSRTSDQLQLLQLLLAAEEPGRLDAAREASLLPACTWLVQQAKRDPEYAQFCRNFFVSVLGRRYAEAGAEARAALSLGVSDLHFLSTDHGNYPSWGSGISRVRDQLPAAAAVELYGILDAPATPWEKFLKAHNSFTRDAVVESIGTAYLREERYAQAASWLRRAEKLPALEDQLVSYERQTKPVNVDPLYDYLNDWQRYDKSLSKPYTKLTLAQKLVELEQRLDTAATPAAKARLCYQLASARYNMSYYGNSWMAVAWARSGADWNEGNYKSAWEKEYYGVHRARALYQQAYELTPDREFKAACYFMMIKCAQRQLVRPGWGEGLSWEAHDAQSKKFDERFAASPHFPQFVKEFGDTKFYKYTYGRCSYLRDFVKKQEAKK
ncbi:MAG: hypothetical protein EOO11_09550 [Chitinophagaceae bacterium]|nr:MAG: hypothetical protein EOO11_09550 [Chitinophagaceae bacterium]